MNPSSSLQTLLGMVVLTLVGCAPLHLRPAPGAQIVPTAPLAAADHDAGVRIVVQPDAWRGTPEHLDRELTPMKVTIDNGSDRPLRICYEDFILETGDKLQLLPLPPLDIRGQVTERSDTPIYLPSYAIVPRFIHRVFRVAPWYAPYYPSLSRWNNTWAINHAYYDIYYPRWTVELPTADMVARAMPEGVIEPGGRLSGFLYFPTLDDDPERVTFKANLSSAREDVLFATLRVPFEAG